jgi:hypothetical protein
MGSPLNPIISKSEGGVNKNIYIDIDRKKSKLRNLKINNKITP